MDESPTCGDKPDNAAVERLRDLAACWLYAGGAMLPDLIDGAAEAIVAGADSPTLGVLAGADAGSVSAEIAPVVDERWRNSAVLRCHGTTQKVPS